MSTSTPLPPQPPVAPRPKGPREREHWDYENVYVRGDRGGYLALIVVLALVAVVFWGGWSAYNWGRAQFDPDGDPGETVLVTLQRGDTSASISDRLEELGVIESAVAYQWYVRLKGGAEFQAGEFEFQENSAVWEVIDVLRDGPARVAQAPTLSITLPEGLTVQQIADRIDAADGLQFDGSDFLRQLRSGQYTLDYGPASDLAPEYERFEGMLFPETYSLLTGSTADDLIRQLVDTTNRVGDRLGIGSAESRVGVTPYEVMIIASLIEEEAKVDEDRPKIARVIYNRLAQGIPLGIDATIVYATGDNVLTVSELETEGPYNTRLVQGLPPTPIASPGEKSIDAALNPESGEWLYYVLTDPDGTHSFSESYEEFLENKQICFELDLGCGPAE